MLTLPGIFRRERVQKPQRDRNLTMGRLMYRGTYTRSTFQDQNGNKVVRDADAEKMMRGNREGIWGTLPPTPRGADAILDEYFRERVGEFRRSAIETVSICEIREKS